MLTERAVPVCGHLGLTPQSVNLRRLRNSRAAAVPDKYLLDDALALEAAGAQLLVLECVPVELAKRVPGSAVPISMIRHRREAACVTISVRVSPVMRCAFGIAGGHIY